MVKKFLVFSSIALLLCCSVVSAQGGIAVTSVDVQMVGGKQLATIVINDAIKISEIQVTKVGARVGIKFPEYVSKKGKAYPQFETLTKQAKDIIEQAIKTKSPAGTSGSLTYKISKFDPFTRPSALKVFCAVDFNNAIRIECKVMESKRGPFISWPARKPATRGKWIDQVVILDKVLKKKIEDELLSKYKTSASETSGEGY